MDIYFFSGTHWDREWYQTYQGFRFRLVQVMDELIEILEKDEDFGVFHLDGQTIVLEDYLEIRPENRDRVTELVKKGKLLIGPWYCMPDELLLSGESLIKNLQKGHQIARSYGAEPLKYGYICDIFGHIAQMPQIFNEMGIQYALLGRGTNEHTTDMHFLWESPDGSCVTTFKLQDLGGYGAVYAQVISPSENDEELSENMKQFVDGEIKRANIPVLLLMDANDHEPCHRDTPAYLRLLKQLYPDADIHHENVMNMCKKLESYKDQLRKKTGELLEPAKIVAPYLHLITNTLSSRTELKKRNDLLQTKLEKIVQPLFAFGLTRQPVSYLDTANTYLLQNHPHDSICGCSIDAVHRDMMYRFAQSENICDEIIADWCGVPEALPNDGDITMSVYHPLPYRQKRLVTVTVPFPTDYKAKYAEPFNYEFINSFHIFDEDGKEIPYGIDDIRTNRTERYFAQNVRTVDEYDLSLELNLEPMAFRVLTIKASKTPSRYLERMSFGENFADNGIIRIDFRPDGTMTLTDHRTGYQSGGLLALYDDGEIGDGWFHANSMCDRTCFIESAAVQLEHESAVKLTYRLTQTLLLPQEIVDFKRSEETVSVQVMHHITIEKNSAVLSVKTEVDNKAKDHRLRLKLASGIEGETYFANQAFCFNERKCGFDLATQNYREREPLEKQMSGIVGKKNGKYGFAFISQYGLHECGVTDAGDIFVTLLRACKRTVMTNGEPDGEQQGLLTYSYELCPFTGDTSYAALQREQDELASGILSVSGGKRNAAGLEILSEGTIFSTANLENGACCIRVYSVSKREELAEIRLPEWVKSTELVTLEGKTKRSLAIKDGVVRFELGAFRFETIKVSK